MARRPKPPADGAPAAAQRKWFAVLRTTQGLPTHVLLAQEARPGLAPPANPASQDASATEGVHPIAEARVGVVPAFMGPAVLLIAVVGVPMALWGVLRIRGNRFLLTTSRVTFRSGLLFRRAHAIALAEVANYGTIRLWVAGGVVVPMEGIINPHGFQRLIEDQADAVRAQQ